MFIKSSLRGQKVHKSMNFVHDLATLLLSENVINDTCQSIPERFAWRVEISG